MSETTFNDKDFKIERTWTTPPPSLTLEHLHIPQDMKGKKVLELFSGRKENSMKAEIEKRGGQHITVDRFREISGGKHVVADAYSDLPFKEESFDYVLMAYPPMYESEEAVSTKMVEDFLTTGLNVLKNDPGCFVGVLTPLSHDNVVRLSDALRERPDIVDDHLVINERTNVPLTDLQGTVIPGEFVYTIRVIRV
jgi:hypothetical protein